MPKQQRKIVFFLGAGASYAAGAAAYVEGGGSVSIPMSGTFWPTFLRFCSAPSRDMIQAFLFRYFMGYSRVPARWKAAVRREALASIDLEEVFTFLSERIRAPGTSSQLRSYANQIWSALVREIGPVFRRFEANSMTRKTYRSLLANHIRGWDTIVSATSEAPLDLRQESVESSVERKTLVRSLL